MSLQPDDVQHIAHLARLRLEPDDTPRYVLELGRILELVERMNAVDTTDTEPMAHPLAASQRLRPDQVTEHDQREAFQRIAPAVQDGLYLVPRVIE